MLKPRLYRPAMYGDWSLVSKLFLGFMYLSNELDESLACGLKAAVFRPVSEVKLPHCPRLTILLTNRWSS